MALVSGGFSGVITRQIGVEAGVGHAGAPAQPAIRTGLTPMDTCASCTRRQCALASKTVFRASGLEVFEGSVKGQVGWGNEPAQGELMRCGRPHREEGRANLSSVLLSCRAGRFPPMPSRVPQLMEDGL